MNRLWLKSLLLASALVGGGPLMGPLATPAQAELSAQEKLHLLALSLREAIVAGNHARTLDLVGQIRATGLPAGNEILFYEGQALYRTGRSGEAEAPLTRYVRAVGPQGENHATALSYLQAVEGARAALRARLVPAVEQALTAEQYDLARQRLADGKTRLPGDPVWPPLEKQLAKEEAEAPARQARRQAELAARTAEYDSCIAAATAEARIGEVQEVRADWGFAVIRFDGAAPSGALEIVAGGTVLPAASGKMTGDGRMSVSVSGGIAAVQPGQVVRRALPKGAAGPCWSQESAVQALKTKLGGIGG